MTGEAGWLALAGIALAALAGGAINARFAASSRARLRLALAGGSALAALLAGLGALAFALPGPVCVLAALAAGFAAGAAILDLATGQIADLQSGVMLMCGLCASVFLRWPGQEIWLALLLAGGGAALSAGILWGVSRLYKAWKGEPGLGDGDIILAGAAGSWAGLAMVGVGLLAASIGTLLVAVALGRTEGRLPFGPGIVVGFAIAYGVHVHEWIALTR